MAVGFQLNDWGSALRITILDQNSNAVNLSNALSNQIVFYKPDDTSFAVTASGVLTNGQMQYQFVSGDLNLVGTWRYQAVVTFSNAVYHSDDGNFKVSLNIY